MRRGLSRVGWEMSRPCCDCGLLVVVVVFWETGGDEVSGLAFH